MKALDLFCLGLSRGPPLITCEMRKIIYTAITGYRFAEFVNEVVD